MGEKSFNTGRTIANFTIGSSETDLWQVSDQDDIADNAGGTTIFDNLTVYKASQSFVSSGWLQEKFPFAKNITLL